MDIIFLLLLFGVYVALAVFVLTQDPRVRPTQLFAALVISAALLTASGIIRLTTHDLQLITMMAATIAPTLALQSIILIWLVLVLFLPHRANQPLAFWALLAPYLFAFLLLLIDAIGAQGWVFSGVELDANGNYQTVFNRSNRLPALISYAVSQVVLVIMTAVIGMRDARFRAQAWSISAGLILTLVVGGTSAPGNAIGLSYAISLPLYIGFAWATLRYELFRPSARVLEAAIESLPEAMLILDRQDRIIFANQAARTTLGLAITSIDAPLEQTLARAELEREHSDEGQQRYRYRGAVPRFFAITDTVVLNDRRATRTLILRDITSAHQQADALREQNEAQRKLLDLVTTLETPVTMLADGVALAPIVGQLDTRRGHELTTRLLQAVQTHRLRYCILDLTGVSTIDTAVAQALTQAIQAIRLLGCNVAITGISPMVAQTLTQLGIGFSGILTTRSPQEAMEWALEQ